MWKAQSGQANQTHRVKTQDKEMLSQVSREDWDVSTTKKGALQKGCGWVCQGLLQ